MSTVVRRPSVRDADDLARINIAAWRDAYAGIVPQSRIDEMTLLTYRQRWLDRIAAPDPGVCTLVAELGGILASYAIGGPYRTQEDAEPEDTTDVGELYAIYTDPRLQGRGAGRTVHDALLSWLADEGYAQAALWVLQDNDRSQSWYTARGWRADGATSSWLAHGHALPEIRLRRGLSAGSAQQQRDHS